MKAICFYFQIHQPFRTVLRSLLQHLTINQAYN